MRKTQKDLIAHESEEDGCGESVGWYAVCIRERGGWGRGGCGLRSAISKLPHIVVTARLPMRTIPTD
jgi:hypothetical protein